MAIGFLQGGVIVWNVIAPTANLYPGTLAGDYAGVTGGATVGIGAGADVLVGAGHSLMLQPVSIERNTGLNVAAGIAAINLQMPAALSPLVASEVAWLPQPPADVLD